MSQAVLMILGDRDRKGKEKQFLWENKKKTKVRNLKVKCIYLFCKVKAKAFYI